MSQWFRLPGKGWSGLSLQLFFLVLLPLTVLLLLVAVGSSLLHQQAMRTMVGERDERAARAAAAAVSEQLEQRASAVQGLAQRAARMEEPAQALHDVGPLLPEFEGSMALFAPDGKLLAATAHLEGWQDLSSTSFGDETTDGEAKFFFAPALGDGAGSGTLTLVAAATVEGFTAAGAFSPTTLARNALSRVFGGGDAATAAVVTADGDLIYRAGPPLLAETRPLQHPGVISALRGESGTTYFADRDGARGDGEHVVAFSPITPVGWALVIEEPWQMLASPLLRTTEWAPLVLAPILLIALIGLGFGALQIVQPLQSLEQKATALAWGDFQAIEEPVGGIAEIQRLQAELVHMAQKVRSAQRGLRDYLGAITAGQEEERRRLARELHDDTIQSLIALNQRIQLAQLGQEGDQADDLRVQTREQLDEMQQMVSQLIADLRRTIHALRPIYLEDLGLAPALQMLVQEARSENELAAHFHKVGDERRLPAEVELALYRIAQEALSNAGRHAAAEIAMVKLRFTPQAVTLVVEDDGRGFVVPESPADLAPQGHYGLLGIHERAELIGAQLTLTSEPGDGTRVQVVVPV
ncbi:MAG TPA: sensor histidine kinase [Candidatus Sulfomarinibacteraceae bacterium]|nr:sensor histidine kinase [Candidatus Sulfomarinibacteraceae bacterium]